MPQYPAVIQLSTLNGTTGFEIDGPSTGAELGFSVSSAGDVNGDGFADLIVGGPFAGMTGAAYVVFGRAGGFGPTLQVTSLTGANGFKLAGASGGLLGNSVASAGDVNGDGFDDMFVGDYNSGRAYVVFGKASGFNATLAVTALNGSNGFQLVGTAEEGAGFCVASAGDVNGDGIDDLIVGAPGAKDMSGPAGSRGAYVVFGHTGTFTSTLNLASLDGTTGFKITNADADDLGGYSAASAGDVNGDGFDDLIVSAPLANGGAGSSYVVFGHSGIFSSTFALSTIEGTNGFELSGVNAYDFSGTSVSSAGDINGDGFDDVVVGASNSDSPGVENNGASYVVFGHAGTFAATVDLGSLNGSEGFAIRGVQDSASSGFSVSKAGDVNGDGFGDVIIGAPNADGRGAAYVVFGTPSGFASEIDVANLTGTNGFKIAGETSQDQTGFSVSAAGDVNDDGFDDLIVGAPGNDFSTPGAAYVVFGRLPTTSVNRTGTNISQKLAGGNLADTLNGLGGDDRLYGHGGNDKLNGGTGDDTAVYFGGKAFYVVTQTTGSFGSRFTVSDQRAGAPDGTDTLTGVEHLKFTSGTIDLLQFPAVVSPTDLVGTNGFVVTGAASGDRSGVSVSSAGDVNGDGFDDFMVGAYQAGSTGAAYVVFGKASGFSSSLSLGGLNGTNGFKISGVAASDFAGKSVSSAGDINGDGFADVIMGASENDTGGARAGAAYVVFGHSGAFAANIAAGSLNGTNGFAIIGAAATNLAGVSVSSAGDVNNDGFDDLIVGAEGADGFAGAAYVVYGKSTGFGTTFNLSTINGTNGFKISAEHQYDYAGFSVSSAGDVNGDGFDDVLVGAYGANAGYLVLGKASGIPANLSLSTLDGTNGVKLTGVAVGDDTGFSVSSAGDVNGDGYADMLVGADFADERGIDSGSAYVVFGKASGFGATLSLAALDGTTGFRINGAATDDRAGVSLSDAGDVNGDGFDDVLVGAYKSDPNGSNSGSAYVVYGKASGFAPTLDLSDLDASTGFQIPGLATDDLLGRSVSSAGDLNNDGFADLIVGARGADSDAGASYVIFGRAPTTAVDRTGTNAAQTLAGGAFADKLRGLGGDDKLYGNGGGDTLNGGAGVDTMYGGKGDDLYYVDNIGDQTIEAVGGGTDTVYTTATFALKNAWEIESLRSTGSAAINLFGNNRANSIYGNAGANKLNGGIGADLMYGNGGNDTYVVDNVGDRTYDISHGGTDLVHSTVNYTLGNYLENLTLDGTGDLRATGNSLANILLGNSGSNTLTGNAGNDMLTGGGNTDYFVYDTAGWGKDTIIDFTAGNAVGHDKINIDHTLFAAYATLLAHTVDGGANTTITYDAANTITLNNVDKVDLTAADFKFT